MQNPNIDLTPAARPRDGDEPAPSDDVAAVIEGVPDLLARIGAALDADLVVLHRHLGETVTTVASQRRGGADDDLVSLGPAEDGVPTTWFPWNLGNLHAAEHVFVRNAGRLRPDPQRTDTLGDLGVGSAVHLAIRSGTRTLGGVCAYWSAERERWDHSGSAAITELARRALDLSPAPRRPPRPLC